MSHCSLERSPEWKVAASNKVIGRTFMGAENGNKNFAKSYSLNLPVI
jgi:hypothetical protein